MDQVLGFLESGVNLGIYMDRTKLMEFTLMDHNSLNLIGRNVIHGIFIEKLWSLHGWNIAR